MANNFRTDRVGMEIKREVNEILQKKVRDPRVQGVTITDVITKIGRASCRERV